MDYVASTYLSEGKEIELLSCKAGRKPWQHGTCTEFFYNIFVSLEERVKFEFPFLASCSCCVQFYCERSKDCFLLKKNYA
jgi:hypothetical protein